MKTKFIFSLLTALLFNFATSGLFAQSIGIDHNLMFGIQMGLSLVPLQLTGCLAEGLNKEIWIPEIIEKFYPETSFVSDSRDFSMWTDNEYLNLQEAGIDPRVFIDNEVKRITAQAGFSQYHLQLGLESGGSLKLRPDMIGIEVVVFIHKDV